MVATCCQSLLCVDNPAYQGNVVMVFPAFRAMTGAELTAPGKCPIRAHQTDWPEAELAKLDSKPGFFLGASGPQFTGPDAEKMFGEIIGIFGIKVDPELPGQTFHELLAEAGGKIECLGLPEDDNSSSKKREAAAAAEKPPGGGCRCVLL